MKEYFKEKNIRLREFKKHIIISAVCVMTAFLTFTLSSVSVYAAPRTMSDGTVFDPEYYAAANPDVVAALGSDPNVLYKHYVIYGKNEGRKPYADASSVSQTPSQSSSQVSNTASAFIIGPYAITKNYTNSKLTDDQLINNAATAFAYIPAELLNQFFTTNSDTMTYSDMAHDSRFATGHVAGYDKQTWSVSSAGQWTLANSAINICTDCSSADSYHMLGSTVHEFGHYFDSIMGSPSKQQTWQMILSAEYPNTGLASYYSDPSEYFAEQFAIYLLPDRSVYNVSKSQCPQSQAVIASLIAQYNASMGAQ